MKTLEKGQEKIQQICEELRHKTIEPAKLEAEEIIRQAEREKGRLLAEAELQAKQIIEAGRAAVSQERSVFESSMEQSVKQSFEALKQAIEQRLFSEELQVVITQEGSSPKLIAKIVTALVAALEKEGLAADFGVAIPKAVPAEEVVQALGETLLRKLKEQELELGDFAAGAKVRLKGKKMTLDVSDEVLKELLSHYVRKDFRALIFQSDQP